MSEQIVITEAVKTMEDLPTLPSVVQKLLVMLRDPEFSARDVSAAICSDQALAARVLKLVNSPAYGIAHDIQSIDRAVIILGSEALQSLVLCAGVTAAMEAMANPAMLNGFWHHAYHVATSAHDLAERGDGAEPSEVFLAGLVHDLGELVLAVLRPDEWLRVRDLGARDRIANEKRYLGLTHTRAGHMLATRWCLPEEIADVAREHHSERSTVSTERPTLAMIALADIFSRLAGAGVEPPPDERWLARLLRTTGFPVGDLAAFLREVDLKLAGRAAFLEIENGAPIRPDFARDGESARVSILGASKSRLQWLQQLLLYHGLEIVPLRSFLTRQADVDLVILDPGSLGRVQLEKSRPFLAHSRAIVATCGQQPRDLVDEILGGPRPHLDLVFSPQELEAVMALRAERG
ncbi:HDOD domain-containing protein [bacterium]|nr:HDOD domain-containing protein [bacterium]